MSPYQNYSHFCIKNSTATPKKLKNSTAILNLHFRILKTNVAVEFLSFKKWL